MENNKSYDLYFKMQENYVEQVESRLEGEKRSLILMQKSIDLLEETLVYEKEILDRERKSYGK